MGQFNKLLDATYHPPRKWVLNSSLSYDCDKLTEEDIEVLKSVGVKVTKKGKVTVPKGFVTDMASVPRLCWACLLYTSPSPRDATLSRMPSSA